MSLVQIWLVPILSSSSAKIVGIDGSIGRKQLINIIVLGPINGNIGHTTVSREIRKYNYILESDGIDNINIAKMKVENFFGFYNVLQSTYRENSA